MSSYQRARRLAIWRGSFPVLTVTILVMLALSLLA